MFILLSTAFFTIIERKILGLFHFRQGPIKVGLWGLIQPFRDAIKLFIKNIFILSKVNFFYWNISSILLFILFLIISNILIIKMENNLIIINICIIIFLIGLSVFPIFWSRFFSWSKFSFIRSKRCIIQIISYELGFIFILIFLISMNFFLNLEIITLIFKKINFIKILLFFLSFLLILRETRRIPFDFIEGESELVSGFNTEYSGAYFSLFFIYEYGIILFFSIIFRIIIINIFYIIILIYSFIHVRSSFPRIRYDQIIIFFWKHFYFFIIMVFIMLK